MIAYEELCRGIVAAIPQGVWVVDPQGRTILNNKHMAEILGAETDSLAEQSCFECLFPEDLAEAQRQFAQGMAGRREPFDFRLRRNDGSAIWVSISCGPVYDASGAVVGLLGLFSDITGRRLEVERVRESEELFRNMASCAPVMLWMSDRDKLCYFFNQGWLDFTGRTMEQEVGDGWTEGVHPDDFQQCVETYRSAFDARRPFEMEHRLRRHDGEYRWILDRGTPRFGSHGEFMGYIGCAADITERKQVEENDRQIARLQRLAAMGEFAAAMAHELKQPLAAIMTNAEVAQKQLDSVSPPLSELRDIVSDILEDDKRASEAIDRIREFMTKRQPRTHSFDLNTAVGVVLQLVGGDAMRRRIELRTQLDQALPPVLGDRVQLQHVLINLAINAMDAMAQTADSSRCLTIQTKANGEGYVEVTMTDRGTGIDPDHLPHLFESFFTTKAEGMGLGLAISRSIVHSHGGRIWAENVPEGGAAFHFTVAAAGN
jgi:PAS domain S-box-containing protein